MADPLHQTTDKPQEMDQAHRERVCRLLFETGRPPGAATQDTFIRAYQAVLLKDAVWLLSELLSWENAKGHSNG